MPPGNQPNSSLKTLLEKRFSYFLSPLESFIHKQTTASILLLSFSLFAFLLSNTPFRSLLETLSDLEIGIVFSHHHFSLSFSEWVSQGLMALFFFLVGLEIKREILAGKLQGFKETSLIGVAALGGILLPALFYYLFNQDGSGQHGWAIPTATDTAFAIGVLALLANRVSIEMTVFLTALAIFDDIGAMIIISFFYSHDVNTNAIAVTGLVIMVLFAANRVGVRNGWFYSFAGVCLWGAVMKAGIHPTFAGLILAMSIPARPVLSQSGFISNIRRLSAKFEQRQDSQISMLGSSGQHSIVADIGESARAATTPLQRWESKMITPIAIIVLPLFALLNAGFPMSITLWKESVDSTITIGIIAGLVIGKPLGILGFTYLAIKTGIGRLPQGVTKNELIGIAFLAGIGFTMSIFFTTLSFPQETELIDSAKLGILISSLLSALLGSLWIYFILPKNGE